MRALLFIVFSFFLTAQGWALPDCRGSWGSHWDNCFGTHTFGPKSQWAGDKYVGEFKDDKFHGQGTYTFGRDAELEGRQIKKGDRFVGEFVEGFPKGDGIYYHANGRIEEGVWDRLNLLYAKDLTPDSEPEPETQMAEDDGTLYQTGSGTGFAVSPSGHVVTNHHVIKGCMNVVVHHNGEFFEANIVSQDPINDLALLRADFQPTDYFGFSTQDADLTQEVMVAGFPFGLEVNASVKVTRGGVTALSGTNNNFSQMTVDAAIQPGNSGGPILDEKANVVGVAVARLSLEFARKQGGTTEGSNYGIKGSVVKVFLGSNNIALRGQNDRTITARERGKKITDATYFLSCWMTIARYKEMKSEKVMFDKLEVK